MYLIFICFFGDMEHFSWIISGTIINNLEGCDILTSSNFNMACQLLEVRVFFCVCIKPYKKSRDDLVCLRVSPLPQVDPKVLEKSLTQRSLTTNRELVSKPLTFAQAVDGRDALVKVTMSHLTPKFTLSKRWRLTL